MRIDEDQVSEALHISSWKWLAANERRMPPGPFSLNHLHSLGSRLSLRLTPIKLQANCEVRSKLLSAVLGLVKGPTN